MEAGDDGASYDQVVFVGRGAGKRWGANDANIAIGYMAGGQTGTASSNDANGNIAIGKNSANAITDGDLNIIVGKDSGSNISSGSNNVVIGGANVSSATGDDQLSISSGDGTPVWITGTSDGSVNLPNSILKINGSVGTDGQVLTSTGSAVAWEDAGGGGSGAFSGATITDINGCYLNQLYPYGDGQMGYGNPFTTYVQYYPFIAPDSGTVGTLGTRLNTFVSNTTMKVGIYSDSNGSPSSLLGGVTLSITSASVFNSTTFTSSITLVKGTQYWVGYMVDDATVNNSLQGSNLSNRGIIYSGQSAGNQAARFNVRSDNNATALPSTPSGVSGYWAGLIPQIYCAIS